MLEPLYRLGSLVCTTVRPVLTFELCLNRDRTLEWAILVHLTPDCQKETLDVASRVISKGVVEKLAIHCCQ